MAPNWYEKHLYASHLKQNLRTQCEKRQINSKRGDRNEHHKTKQNDTKQMFYKNICINVWMAKSRRNK